MDLHLTSEQSLLRDSAQKFVAAAGPKVARGLRGRAPGFAPGMLQEAGELGWLGLLVPAPAGGGRGGWTAAARRALRSRTRPPTFSRRTHPRAAPWRRCTA